MTDMDYFSEDDVINLGPVEAFSIEVGDQIIVEGDFIEVSEIIETEDVDEVVVVGYSHVEGDKVRYSLYADDEYNLWSI